MTPTQPVRAGTADQLARLAAHRDLDHADTEQLDAVAHWIIGDVGGAGPASVLWANLRGPCLDLYALLVDDYRDDDLDFDPALTEAERYDATYQRLTEEVERAVWIARLQARENARLADYRAHRADVENRIHPKAAS